MFDFVYYYLDKLGYNHPIHPTQVHMPIGLAVGAFLFALAAWIFKREALFRSARHCFILALIFFFPTVFFGVMDWMYYYQGAMLFAIKVKIILAGILFILLTVGIIQGRRPASKVLGFNYLCCFFIVIVLGYFGGIMVFTVGPTAPAELASGEKLFTRTCGACHPQGGNSINPNLPLITAPQLSAFSTFEAFLRDPKMPNGQEGAMPAFGKDRLSEEQIKQLYNYINKILVRPPRKQPGGFGPPQRSNSADTHCMECLT